MKLKDDLVCISTSIIDALKIMDRKNKKLLFIHNKNKYVGLISLGDIQRAILNKISLSQSLVKIIRPRKDTTEIKNDKTITEIKRIMLQKRTEAMPIVNKNGELEKIIYWEDVFNQKRIKKKFNLPVVIMAGGKGTRLKPLTNVIPKPLIPIGEKTILETIIESFSHFGCTDFFLSVNHQSEIIEFYMNSKNLSEKVTYFKENKPLGTAGSLYLLKNKIKSTFIVSNCDIIIDQDYSEILDFHKKNKNQITIVAAVKNLKIPYGTIKIKKKGLLERIEEKPNLSFLINTGLYILEPNLINRIPTDTFFHITDLIESLKKENENIGVFPVSENSWTDIGEWEQYLKAIKRL